jgi:hypothetical protein
VLTDAARSASRRRVARNPQEATEGLNSNVIPVEEVRVGTSENSGAILHLTTADNIPIAVELPVALLGEVVDQLRHVLENRHSVEGSSRVH